MVRAYHVIFGMYGFWLPNDERGSWSDLVGAWELLRFGKATTVDARRSLARRPFDPQRREEARRALKYPIVKLNGAQARAVGRGFANSMNKSEVLVLACAILPQHVHLVIARHRLPIESIINQFKGAATRQLIEEGIHPQAAHQGGKARPPKAFARGQWKVFLDDDQDIVRSVGYVEGNPEREGLPRQRWSCVRGLDLGAVRAPLTGRD